ncbi:MAG: redoxin domain-containing protein [Candidatus Acidiferrales bacterium]
MISPVNPQGPSRGTKKWLRRWQFFARATVCAVLLIVSVAFAQSQGHAGSSASAPAPKQESSGDKGIQPDLEYPILAIGAPAPDFDLPGVDGKNHRLADYAKAKILAIVFECDHCPVSQLYEDRIEKIYHDYKDKGVALVAINPNNPKAIRLDEMGFTDVGDSLADMKIRAAFRHIDYPYLYDGETQAVAMKFGVVATPHIFIFDQQRKLRYQGGIDDNMTESLATSHAARDAIDALLAGHPVAVETTRAFGCSTKWLSKSTGVEAEMERIDAEPVTVTMASADDLKKLRANSTGKLLLVNFWATWCGPCISEFPDLQDTYRMYRNRDFTMVTVSENDPSAKAAVLKFLEKMHASTTNLAFASADTNAMQDAFDPKMGAAVPFTLLIAPNGDVVYQEQGDVTILKLRRAILLNLPDTADYPGQQAFWSGR